MDESQIREAMRLMGRKGGQASSPRKTAAARKNALKRWAKAKRALPGSKPSAAIPQPMPSRPARNGPCPCKSGKKWKRCCGRLELPVLLD